MTTRHAIAFSLGMFALIAAAPSPAPAQVDIYKEPRLKMVTDEIVEAGIKNERVIESMKITPRHEFVPPRFRQQAYFDMALAIGESQTISPPFIVAFMTEALDPKPTDRVLEIGTGSGYQAAVLSPLVKEVYSIEIVEELGKKAAKTLDHLKYKNVHVRVGDGYLGWPDAAPFDKIIVTCSPEKVPAPLVKQLKEGGMMVVPVGERYQQNLYLLTKVNGEMKAKALDATLFVPMTGAAESVRQVLPDPTKPKLVNGSFEETLDKESKLPTGWHYLRQGEIVEDAKEAHDGKKIMVFTNDDPGRGAHALQGFAIDGRSVVAIDLSAWIRGKQLRYGQDRSQWPKFTISFYDEKRVSLGQASLGAFAGNLDWQEFKGRAEVPVKAREAILDIGLAGGIGELAIDDIKITPVSRTPQK